MTICHNKVSLEIRHSSFQHQISLDPFRTQLYQLLLFLELGSIVSFVPRETVKFEGNKMKRFPRNHSLSDS